jgi:hypothetical protein
MGAQLLVEPGKKNNPMNPPQRRHDTQRDIKYNDTHHNNKNILLKKQFSSRC